MSFEIELSGGVPVKISGDTADELAAALGLANGNGHAAIVAPKRAARKTRRKGSRGWTREVYALAKAEGISAVDARKRLAANRRIAKPALKLKRTPK